MEHFLTQTEKNTLASKKIERIKSFYTHLGAYISINIVLFILMMSGAVNVHPTFWQTTFTITAGLGALGVAGHGLGVFGHRLLLSKNWEERKLKQLLDKENNK